MGDSLYPEKGVIRVFWHQPHVETRFHILQFHFLIHFLPGSPLDGFQNVLRVVYVSTGVGYGYRLRFARRASFHL